MSPGTTPRAWPVTVSLVTTALQLVVTTLGVLGAEDSAWRNLVAAFSIGALLLGMVLFLVALLRAAGRSRVEELWFGAVFLLTGPGVPAGARAVLRGAVVVQTVIGLGGAVIAPFTPVAFSVLVPMAGLGSMAYYGATEGSFAPRIDED